MTVWREPAWDPSWLTPDRLCRRHGFVRSGTELAARGAAEAAGWTDRLPPLADGTPGAWVLVGGAGLLGARIAAQLLDAAADAAVVIVARRPDGVAAHWTAADGRAAAARRLRDPRLRLIAADLAGERVDWAQQVPQAAAVLHLGAAMSALAAWDRLAPVNLAGLRASVALARRDDAVLQLASTLSVFVSSNAQRADRGVPLPPDEALWLHGGYAQTKAAAEHALLATGLPRWQIVRYGLLVPEGGVPFPAGHFAPAFAAALAEVAALPAEAERAAVDLTPVGGAAAAAIGLALSGAPGIVHHANPQAAALQAVVRGLEAASGTLPVIATPAWVERVAALPAIPRALLRAAFGKTCFLQTDAARAPLLNVDLFQSTHRRFVDAGTVEVPSPETLMPGVVASMLADRGRR